MQANDPSGIEPMIMPPFESNAFIIEIDNHASRCMDFCKKHSSDLKQTKSGTLTKGVARKLKYVALSTRILWMIMTKCITWPSSKQLMFLTYHMHYFHFNIGASKQTKIFGIAMAPKWNNTKTTVSCTGVNEHFLK